MDRDAIDEIVCEIMKRDGPDRHVDGHEYLTDFIIALMEGRGQRWFDSYVKESDARLESVRNYRWR